MTRRRRGRGTRFITFLLVAAAVAAAVVYGPTLLHRYGDRLFSPSRCTASVDGAVSTLTAEQADNAALIAAAAIAKGLPDHSVTVALAAALQESDLRNLDYGDRDSLGLFQQRPSQGWGTAEQIRDPYYAAGQFYDHLVAIDGWESLPVTEAAQAVQRSGHPSAYADHEKDARAWARVLTGEVTPESLTCSLPRPDAARDAPAAFARRASDDFGSRVRVSVESAASVRAEASDEATGRAVVAWSIAVASRWPVTSVRTCDARWDRESNAWGADDGAPVPCTVAVIAFGTS